MQILTLQLNKVNHLLAVFQGYGYTLEQSTKALNTHKSVKKALHVLGGLNHQPGGFSCSKVTFRCDKTFL